MTPTHLNGLRVLVTRPAPGGEALCAEINAAGGAAIFFPTIHFAPVENTAALQQQLNQLENCAWVIFISPQAVYASSASLAARFPEWPSAVKIAAIGAGTAAALRAANFPVTIVPEGAWHSEGLLALPEFNAVSGKKIMLIAGAEGRDTLATTLTARGAEVIACVTYRRCLPDVKVQETLTKIQNRQVDAIVCASGTGLQNLKKLLTDVWTSLRKIPLIVVSERLKALAQQLGFKRIFLAKNASHSAIISTLSQELAKGRVMEEPTTTNETATEATATTSTESTFKLTGTVFVLIAIVVLLAGMYFAYFHILKNNSQLTNVAADLNNKISQDQVAIANLERAVQDNQQIDQQLQATVANQQQAFTNMLASQQSNDQWRVQEAQYLTSLAHDNLQLGDNLPMIVTMLQNADQKLRDLTDPKILAIRKALATDIATLQAIAPVDITGIYLQLTALNDQVDKLPLPVSRPEAEQTAVDAPEKKLSWWRRGLQQTWQVLSKVVVVRYNQGGERPFIPPDQQEFLNQNVHALFAQALSATVHRETTIFHTSLEQAQKWIKKYYLADSPVTQALLNSLGQLQNQTLRPTLPELTSLQAFHEYFAANTPTSTPQ